MRTIKDYIINEFKDNIGNTFEVGDWIEFDVKGLRIMGEVTNTFEDSYEVKPIGFRYSPNLLEEDVKKIKKSLKDSYKLNTKRKVFKLAKPKGKENFRYYN